MKLRPNNQTRIKMNNYSVTLFNIILTILLGHMMMTMMMAICSVNALKMSVSIPELVKLNDAFWLNCSYQNQQQKFDQADGSSLAQDHMLKKQQQSKSTNMEDIYAIKWYKDDEEFYRYLPNAHPKVSIYETNGIQLDQTKSHQGNVLLSKADVNSEGNYRCEILSEAPLFETVRKSKHLKVYALPVRGPRIEILDSSGRPKSPKAQEISYAVGDKIELRCNSAPSKPAAKLRWYLNEHELTIPAATGAADKNGSAPSLDPSRLQRRLASAAGNNRVDLGYDVRVTPIEYRQHYKGIYSSHSTLSLVLQQDDLINNKISFKCLASMRQEVPLKSKQLIVLMSPPATSANLLQQQSSSSNIQTNPLSISRLLRNRRSSSSSSLVDSSSSDEDNLQTFVNHQFLTSSMDQTSEAHVHHRQRPQHHRHSVSRLPQQSSSSSSLATTNKNTESTRSGLVVDSISAQQDSSLRNNNNMLYIYEDSDSTLGSSIIDSLESLENYLRQRNSMNDTNLDGNNNSSSALPMNEFNRADNLDYVQMQRERLTRHQKFLSPNNNNNNNNGGSFHNFKRFQPNSLVKSPLYLDENDPMRPIISWPPLESGKLILLPPGSNLVAIPTAPVGVNVRRNGWLTTGSGNEQQKFILPPSELISTIDSPFNSQQQQQQQQRQRSLLNGELNLQPIMLERLVGNLNCTCTEGSLDTRLNWLVNDNQLSTRDLKLYPTRVSPDHRQTWLTIGLQPTSVTSTSAGSISSLQTILAQYAKNYDTTSSFRANSANQNRHSDQLMSSNQHQPQLDSSDNQIKFTCQAIHSMLLYSSSEMITFDFNPPPTNQLDTNSIDKMSSLASNVIQATSASQSSSAEPRQTLGLSIIDSLSIRSQTNMIIFIISFILFHISHHPITITTARNYSKNSLVSAR